MVDILFDGVIDKIKGGTISHFVYDPNLASLKKAK